MIILALIYDDIDNLPRSKTESKGTKQSKLLKFREKACCGRVIRKWNNKDNLKAAATSHLEDSTDEARSEIYRAIHKKKKWMAECVFDKIISITEKDTKRKAVEKAKEYILGNWSGIMISMKSKDTNVRCSAEGHVSHVYADRMSSRPLGWCRVGADKMSRLRIYRYNQGDMLELVRFQKKELKQVAGAEEVIYSATEMLRMEKKNRKN